MKRLLAIAAILALSAAAHSDGINSGNVIGQDGIHSGFSIGGTSGINNGNGSGSGPAPGSAIDINFPTASYTGCISPAACLTVSRASPETVTSTGGVITYAANNVLAYSNAGLQKWQAATNLTLQSQGAFSNATYWTSVNTTATDNTIVAPDLNTTASVLNEGVGAGVHNIAGANIAYTSGSAYDEACYVHAGTGSFVQLTFGAGVNSGLGYADFNLTTGAMTSTGGTFIGSGITPLTAGWYRVWIEALATSSTTTTGTLVFMSNTATATRAPSYTGTGNTIDIWGCMTELVSASASLPFAGPSPYIPTTTVAVTRPPDIVTATGALATLMTQLTATVVDKTNSSQQSVAAVLIDDNGTPFLAKNAANNALATENGTLTSTNTATWTAAVITGLGWDPLGRGLNLNNTIANDNVVQTPTGPFTYGSSAGASFLNGNETEIIGYNTNQYGHAAPTLSAMLLEDNSSFLLLEDGVSHLCLESGC